MPTAHKERGLHYIWVDKTEIQNPESGTGKAVRFRGLRRKGFGEASPPSLSYGVASGHEDDRMPSVMYGVPRPPSTLDKQEEFPPSPKGLRRGKPAFAKLGRDERGCYKSWPGQMCASRV